MLRFVLKICRPWPILLLLSAEAWAADEPAVTRVAMLPLSSVGVPEELREALRQRLFKALSMNELSQIVPLDQVDFAVMEVCAGQPDHWVHLDLWECLEKDDNLFLIGERLEAKAVVAVKVAAMGDRLGLKLRLADVSTKTVSTEIVNSKTEDEEAMAVSLTNLMLLHYRLSQPEPPLWYRRWQTWALVGAGALVATTVAVAVALQSRDSGGGSGFDFHGSLP